MELYGVAKHVETLGVEPEVLAVQATREPRAAGAVALVGAVVAPFGVVQKREERDDVRARATLPGEPQAVVAHAGPVRRPVDAVPVEREVLAKEAREREEIGRGSATHETSSRHRSCAPRTR